MKKSKILVVSAVNLTEGGGLTVLRECLFSAVKLKPNNWKIIALVHDKNLINQPEVKLIELPKSKDSWLSHLYHEWIIFRQISKRLNPDLWFSLHDVTPLVEARRQAVYCHNPAPFYSMSWREVYFSPKFWIFTLVYRYLYRLFIKRNYFVVVQQNWLRNAFRKMFGNIPMLVAYPTSNMNKNVTGITASVFPPVFLYPVIPRFFKNFEVICKAAQLLQQRGVTGFHVRLTLDGSENRYSKWLFEKYKSVAGLQFIGLQSKDMLAKQYELATAVIFPSKLETWGLPISEAKLYNKPLLLADLPYAHEAVGNYNKVSFFTSTNANELADLMQAVLENNWQPTTTYQNQPEQPFARNWGELWSLLIEGL